MAYLALSFVKKRLQGLVPLGNSGTPRFGNQTGGVKLTDEEIEEFQEEAEAECLRNLSKLYRIPLKSTVNEGTTLNDFQSMTKYSLQGLFLDATILRIMSYMFAQEGMTINIRNFMKDLGQQLESNMKKSLRYDTSDQTVIPAFNDLYLSELYMPRQENLIPEVTYGTGMRINDDLVILRKLD